MNIQIEEIGNTQFHWKSSHVLHRVREDHNLAIVVKNQTSAYQEPVVLMSKTLFDKLREQEEAAEQ